MPLARLPERLYTRFKDCDTLNDGRWLLAVRLVRSNDNVNFYHSTTAREGAYGLSRKEWARMNKRGHSMRDLVAIDRQAYRYFVHCWHELCIAGINPTAFKVALLWEHGDEAGLKKARREKVTSKFATAVAKKYEELSARAI